MGDLIWVIFLSPGLLIHFSPFIYFEFILLMRYDFIFGNLSVFSCRYPAPVASICLRISPFFLPNPGDGKSSLRLLRHPPAHRGRMLRMRNVGQTPDWPNVWCRITSIHIIFKWHFRNKILTIAKKICFFGFLEIPLVEYFDEILFSWDHAHQIFI